MSASVGTIFRLPLRQVWAHEARDFTQWLSQHLDLLSSALGISLSIEGTEMQAGDFLADMIATDADGDRVVIENQYGTSDHDHLGKLLTYLSAYDAKTAVWIVEQARPEHVAAVVWLNQSTDADFVLLKAEAIRIEESLPALLLTTIVSPTPESKAVGAQKREMAASHLERREFWNSLLEMASRNWPAHPHKGVSAGTDTWLGAGIGIAAGVAVYYTVNQFGWRVWLSLAAAAVDASGRRLSDALYECLSSAKAEVEQAFGGPLEWSGGEDAAGGRVTFISDSSCGYKSPRDQWPAIHESMIATMQRLMNAVELVKPRLKQVCIDFSKT